MAYDKNKYGFPEAKWEEAKEEMRLAIIEVAEVGELIAYSDLVGKIKTIQISCSSSAMACMLGEISESEDAAGRGMLSVVVVHKLGDKQPGEGFFKFAKTLGRDASDTQKCWIEELNKVFGIWRNNKTRRLS